VIGIVDTLAKFSRSGYIFIAVPKISIKLRRDSAKMHAEGGLKKMLFDMTCAEAVKCRAMRIR